MFACLELLKVSESVARRTGDLSAQVGRRVVCVAPCRLSKPVQAKSAPSMMKGENCPSKVRPSGGLLGLFSPFIIGGGNFFDTWTTHITRRPTCAERSPFRLSTTPNMQTWFRTFFFLF